MFDSISKPQRAAAAMLAIGAAIALAPTVNADPVPGAPNCDRSPVFGLNPYIRIVCDQPIQEDGSWTRARLSHYLDRTRSSSNGYYRQGGWPDWVPKDVIPGGYFQDEYRVTWDTIPPGEPGHLG